MADDLRSLRESIINIILSGMNSGDEDDGEYGDGNGRRVASATADTLAGVRSLLQMAFDKAGRGKDDVVQIIAKEIGVAVAAMLREPLAELAKNQRLQVSFEFTPKSSDSSDKGGSETPPGKPRPRKRKSKSTPRESGSSRAK